MSEFAGTLRERIVIERPISVRNAMGLQEPGWEQVCRCLASVALESVGPESEAQSLSAMPRYRVGIRRRDGIAIDANCGRSTVIIAVDGNDIRVRDLPRGETLPGCRVDLREGCDKRFATCIQRFANAVNFRGEPYLPGADLLTRYPGA